MATKTPDPNFSRDPLAEYIVKRYATMKGSRVNWESLWEQISRYIVPNKDDIWDNATPGEDKTEHLYDSSAKRYCNELSNALHSMLTNPTTRWFELSTGIRDIDTLSSVRKWNQEIVSIMLRVLGNSNFQEEILEVYQDLGSFGTAPFRIEEDPIDVIRCQARPIYKCYIDENARGKIDFIIRKYKFSVRAIVQQFGGEVLNREMADKLKNDPSFEYEILHAVGPIEDLAVAEILPKGLKHPYFSAHVLTNFPRLLNDPRKGFHEFPYAVPRWSKLAGEIYGRSPGMDVLPDIRTINAMKKVILQGAQLAIAPPLQIADNSMLRPLKFKPFGINYRRPGSDKIEPIATGARPDLGYELLDKIGMAIHDGYYINALKTVQQDRMTATEVIQRRDEQLRALGGILGRLQNELLSPVINRVFGICFRAGMFPPTPKEIEAAGGAVLIKYTSTLARAQITGEQEGFQRALSQVLPIVQSQPDIMDNIDGDAILRLSFDAFGVDERYLKSEDAVAEIRQQKAEQMAQQQDAQMAAEQTQAASNIAPLVTAVNKGQQM